MNAPLDEAYLNWLYSQIGSVKVRNLSRTHWKLARQLYTKEFVWIVPNDDNRLEDGRYLRHEFLESIEADFVDPDWMELGCSMLEMLVALSRRLSFQDYGTSKQCFWEMIRNIDLEDYNDAVYDKEIADHINETLERIIWRTYLPSGAGGLFPLEDPQKDQRDIEIWYQAAAYLVEKDYL